MTLSRRESNTNLELEKLKTVEVAQKELAGLQEIQRSNCAGSRRADGQSSSQQVMAERREVLEQVSTAAQEGSLGTTLIVIWEGKEAQRRSERISQVALNRREEQEAARVLNWSVYFGKIMDKPNADSDPDHWLNVVDNLPMTLREAAIREVAIRRGDIKRQEVAYLWMSSWPELETDTQFYPTTMHWTSDLLPSNLSQRNQKCWACGQKGFDDDPKTIPSHDPSCKLAGRYTKGVSEAELGNIAIDVIDDADESPSDRENEIMKTSAAARSTKLRHTRRETYSGSVQRTATTDAVQDRPPPTTTIAASPLLSYLGNCTGNQR